MTVRVSGVCVVCVHDCEGEWGVCARLCMHARTRACVHDAA